MSIFFKSKSIIGNFLSNIGFLGSSDKKQSKSYKNKESSNKVLFKTIKDYNLELEKINKSKKKNNKKEIKYLKEKKENIKKVQETIYMSKIREENITNNNIINLEEKRKEKGKENTEKIENIANFIDTIINVSKQLEKETIEINTESDKKYFTNL